MPIDVKHRHDSTQMLAVRLHIPGVHQRIRTSTNAWFRLPTQQLRIEEELSCKNTPKQARKREQDANAIVWRAFLVFFFF